MDVLSDLLALGEFPAVEELKKYRESNMGDIAEEPYLAAIEELAKAVARSRRGEAAVTREWAKDKARAEQANIRWRTALELVTEQEQRAEQAEAEVARLEWMLDAAIRELGATAENYGMDDEIRADLAARWERETE